MPEFHAADSILNCVFNLNISHPVAMYTCKPSDCTVEAALQDMQTPGSTAPAVLLWQSQRIAGACPSEASTPEKTLQECWDWPRISAKPSCWAAATIWRSQGEVGMVSRTSHVAGPNERLQDIASNTGRNSFQTLWIQTKCIQMFIPCVF